MKCDNCGTETVCAHVGYGFCLCQTCRTKAAQALGSLGGKAGKGKSKARSSEQARRAVNVRWDKYRKLKENKQ